ncbi:MAG: leucyl aminopeptidase [Chloroflexi bacterium]|nr:leucyl aminopeptidase [Chloroflexota bacterium]
MWIELAPAPAKPGLGEPGKEPGEIALLQKIAQDGSTQTLLRVSLGQADKIDAETIRRAGGAISRWLDKNDHPEAGIDLDGLQALQVSHPVRALYEGLQLGAFNFDRYKSDKKEKRIARVSLVTSQPDAPIKAELDGLQDLTAAVNLARAWAHEPANVINPVSLAARVQEIAGSAGLKCTILDDKQLTEMGAGAILAVGQGSRTPPRMMILEYPGQASHGQRNPVVLVGKTITFDTGGYSLKDGSGIRGMKYDKSGGMAVLGTLVAASMLKLPHPLVGIIAAAENMVSSESYRPDDIISTLSGKTVEIISTDAEGRLVLADALTYAQRNYHPQALIDLATLTGGVVVALGHVRAGVMSNDPTLSGKLTAAGETTFERVWPLPLDEDYFKPIKGDEADIKNSGGREGAPIFGGIFLKQFVDDAVPWAHVDIAGTATTNEDLPYCPKGATGFGVRLLIEYLQNLDPQG